MQSAARMAAGAPPQTAMTFEIAQQQIGLAAGPERAGIFTMQRENFLEIVALRGQSGECGYGAIMWRQLRIFNRPVRDVQVAMRQHGCAPDIAQAAQCK